MGLHYQDTHTFVAFGSKDEETFVRTPAALVSTYSTTVNSLTFETDGFSKLNLDLLYTTGAAETNNNVDIEFEGSPDRTNFYRIPNESVAGGISTLTQREFTFVGASAATAYTISIGLDIFYKFMRVSAKESNVAVNFGTIFGEITLMGL